MTEGTVDHAESNGVGRRRASAAIVAVIVVIAGLIAVVVASRDSEKAQSSPAGSNAPITILWIGDTTGPAKVYGDVQLAGVKGAADYFNSIGGIDGHRVEVKAFSDNSDPTIAASILTEQLAAATPTMVWAGSTSLTAGPMIPILAKQNVFAVSLIDGQAQCQAEASTNCPNEWFLSTPVDVIQGTVAQWMKQSKHSHVGILEETTAYSATETPEFLKAAASNGLTVKTVSFPPSAVDLTPQMQELHDDHVDVVYSEGIGSAKYAFAARAALEWDVPIIFDPSASALDLTKLTDAENLADAFEITPFGIDGRHANPAMETMVKWSSPHGAVTSLPLNVTGTGWDAVVALNAAVQTAGGSLAVADLNAAMLKLPPTDALRVLTHQLGYSEDNHVNILGAPDDYVVMPVGPLVDGRVREP